jgi:hypothetical protein
MINWGRLTRLTLFGRKPTNPDDGADAAESAEWTIEERLTNIKTKIARGGFRTLSRSEISELHDDICKILEFVERVLSIIETSKRIEAVDASIKRLKLIRTRVNKIREDQNIIAAKMEAA